MSDKSIFFQCKVLTVEDPMMLGRIRAVRLIDNYKDILKSISDPPWNEQKDIWTSRDPFVFNPLLPYFIYQVPKVDELIQVIYLNKDFKYVNQYYVQNTFSSPTATNFQFFEGGNKFTGIGAQIANPKPLKNQDGTLTDQSIHKGVFPEPGDNAILGRGSADLIVKQDEILIRAGKFKGETLHPNVIPTANQQRGFLQLSKFGSIKTPQPSKTYYELKENVVLVNYLIEWVVTNPENTQDKFTGEVYLFQLKPDISVNSKNLTVGSPVAENLKNLVSLNAFNSLSKQDTIKFINNFIQTCNNDNSKSNGVSLFHSNDNKFPIFYRPNQLMYSLIRSSDINALAPDNHSITAVGIKNIGDIYNGVKLNPPITGGFGLIYAKDKVGTPYDTTKKVVPQSTYVATQTSYGALGSDKLFLLSHNSQIPGKGKINFDDTLYGISIEKFADEIMPKTSSLVRGEELLELINMIVRFLVTHTHAYPGLPPVPITQDGSNVTDLLTELQNAVDKILNENIRLN